jgi:hypothetical protein
MVNRVKEHAEKVAERKRNERDRRRRDGWSYVTVALPPGAAEEVQQLAAERRAAHLEAQG